MTKVPVAPRPLVWGAIVLFFIDWGAIAPLHPLATGLLVL